MTLRIGTIKEAIERKLIKPVQFINLGTYPLRKLFGAEDLKLYYTKWGSAFMPLRWGRDNDEIECKICAPSITRLSHKQNLEAVEDNPCPIEFSDCHDELSSDDESYHEQNVNIVGDGIFYRVLY